MFTRFIAHKPNNRPTLVRWGQTSVGAQNGEAKFCYCLRLQQAFIGAVN